MEKKKRLYEIRYTRSVANTWVPAHRFVITDGGAIAAIYKVMPEDAVDFSIEELNLIASEDGFNPNLVL